MRVTLPFTLLDLVLNKTEKDVITVFTWLQNNYFKINSGKSHLIAESANILHINVEENYLSSSKYEELRGILREQKLKFEDHL